MKDDRGNQFNFQGDPINSGGEGKIYKTTQSGFVAKVYDKPPTSEQINKLKKMIANPPKSPPTHGNHVAIAWPTSLIFDNFDNSNKCIGFLMPQIGRNVQLIEVYNPKRRKQVLPKFDWLFLHTTALNFTKTVNSLHRADYVIGDIKPQNILVDDSALVSIVDTDSFQVRDGAKVYRCPVASEGFTPPELLGVNTSTVTQTVYHDRYRIALIIYHLLFTRHPFDEGTWILGDSPSQVELMQKGVWLYNPQGLLQSHKVTIPLQVVHPKLQELFKKCFNDGHKDAIKRPSADEWSEALKLAIDDLTSCGKVDNHKYSNNYGKCYWCVRKIALNMDIFHGEAPKIKISPPKLKTNTGKTIFRPTSQPPSMGTPTVLPPAPVSPLAPQPSTPYTKTKKVIGGILLSVGVVCLIVGYGSWVAAVGIVLGIMSFGCFSD